MPRKLGSSFLPPDLNALSIENSSEESGVGETLSTHLDALMAIPGVVMVGETLDPIGRPAILVGVKTAGHLSRLPSVLDGVPIVTQVIGEVDAQ